VIEGEGLASREMARWSRVLSDQQVGAGTRFRETRLMHGREHPVELDRIWQPDDLFAVLYEPSIEIFPSMTDENGIPRTLVDLGAEFEDEHGVSVRIDGTNVLNLGYSGEA
jgi:hypothetical protein